MIKRTFEAIPSLAAFFYEKVPARALGNFYREVASEVVEHLPRGRVMDVGTGPGYLPIEIAKLNDKIEIIGIDLSPKMIQLAKANARERSVENVEFQLADANKLPFRDGSFDFVISTGALHHWCNPAQVFSELNRLLRKEGYAWIYDLRRDARSEEISDSLGKRAPGARYMRWAFKFHGLKTEEYFRKLQPLLGEMGLAQVRIEEKNAFMRILWKK